MEDKEWYDQQELATEWGVHVRRINRTVITLQSSEPRPIVTRLKPGDRRYLQVHKDSIAAVRKAAGLDPAPTGAPITE
jgi:hypothetical protein